MIESDLFLAAVNLIGYAVPAGAVAYLGRFFATREDMREMRETLRGIDCKVDDLSVQVGELRGADRRRRQVP